MLTPTLRCIITKSGRWGKKHSSVDLYAVYMFRFKLVITSHIFFNVCVTDNMGPLLISIDDMVCLGWALFLPCVSRFYRGFLFWELKICHQH